MIRSLNGWQRLWIVASFIYFVIICGYTVLNFPQPENYKDRWEYIAKLSPQSRALLLPRPTGWRVLNFDSNFFMPDGTLLEFENGVSKKKISSVKKEYWALVTAATNERRWLLIASAALWWSVPSIALYALGLAIGWVYRGFRGK